MDMEKQTKNHRRKRVQRLSNLFSVDEILSLSISDIKKHVPVYGGFGWKFVILKSDVDLSTAILFVKGKYRGIAMKITITDIDNNFNPPKIRVSYIVVSNPFDIDTESSKFKKLVSSVTKYVHEKENG